MSEFITTLSELQSKAEQLNQLAQTFKSERDQLQTTEAALNSMWEGEAKTAFDTAFKNDLVQLQNFYNAILAYVQVLKTIQNDYSAAEEKNLSIATTRTYH